MAKSTFHAFFNIWGIPIDVHGKAGNSNLKLEKNDVHGKPPKSNLKVPQNPTI
jgi:hypothetical protein